MVRLALEHRVEQRARLGEVALGQVEAAERHRQAGVEGTARAGLLEVRDGGVERRLGAAAGRPDSTRPSSSAAKMVPSTQCASALSGSMASAWPAARVASSVRLARALSVAISAGMVALFGSASAARR